MVVVVVVGVVYVGGGVSLVGVVYCCCWYRVCDFLVLLRYHILTRGKEMAKWIDCIL